MTDADEVEDAVHELTFYVQRCIRYHMRRSGFFMRWGRFTAFVGVVFGSAAAATLFSKAPSEVTAVCALLVTLASSVDLVVGTGQRAWLHNDLRKRYLEIEAELISTESPTSKVIRSLNGKVRKIEADEPPTLPALELLARNDVIRSMYPKEQADKLVCQIGWFKRATAQWFDWDTSNA